MGKILMCLNSRIIDVGHGERGTENSDVCQTLNVWSLCVV